MGLRLRFNLVLLLAFALVWGACAWYFRVQAERLANEVVAHEARLQMQTALAIREYTQDLVKPLLEGHPELGFQSQSVPAYAAQQTFARLYAQMPAYRYREVALNPTNPGDRPDDWERKLIEDLRANAQREDAVQVLHHQREFVHAVRPLRVTKPACLQCHGKPEDAPAGVLKRFPQGGGFGWQLNEVIGAQILTVPTEVYRKAFTASRQQFEQVLLVIFGLLLLVSNLVLQRLMVKPVHAQQQALQKLADTDALTGLGNRRHFSSALDQAIGTADHASPSLVLLALDLDHFKAVNDGHGHAAGDRVLQHLAELLKRDCRPGETLARLGGEEFALLLPGIDAEHAAQRAEALRAACESLDVGLGRPVTLSVGLAPWRPGETSSVLMQRADAALYRAKSEGRNRVAKAD